MKVIIDRFEGDLAIVEIEEGLFGTISKALIPNADEGDVINISIDKTEAKNKREKINNLINDLFIDWLCSIFFYLLFRMK